MPQLTFSEKIEILLANIEAYPLFLILFSIPIVVYFISKTKFKKGGVILYLLGAITILAFNLKQIPTLLDNLVEYVINIMNFPTMGLVLGIVFAQIVIIIMTFVKNYRKNIKIINSLGFILVQIMFGVSLQIISKNDMNVSTVQNLSASLDLMVLLQMIMLTFFLQMALVLLSKMIDVVTIYLDGTAKVKEEKIEIAKTEKVKTFIPVKNILTNTYASVKNKAKMIGSSITEATNSSKEKLQAMRDEREVKREVKKEAKLEIIKAKKEAKMEIIEAKKAAKLVEIESQKEKQMEVEPVVQNNKNDEFSYGIVNPVNIMDEASLEVKNEKTERNVSVDIAEIAVKVESIPTSNRFITESTKVQMEQELLAYKEQLLIYRQEQLKKEQLAKKQVEDFNNIFNISYDDLKKSY